MTAPALILSGLEHDMHAHAVRWALSQAGAQAQWISTWADAALDRPVSMQCDFADGLQWYGGPANCRFGSIWFRRPRHPSAAYLPQVNAADHAFVFNEWKRYELNLNALAGSMPGAFWVNPPDAALRAENKLVQMQAAQHCGLRFPPMLVSNDPERIRAFAAAHGPIIYKPFQTHSWQDVDGHIHSSYARTVHPEQLQDDASLRLCPGIFQSRVTKSHDLRVMMIGERVFTARFDTPPDDDCVDWRAASMGDRMRHGVAELPSALEQTLHALMRDLGLVFGCIDLVVDAAGDVHFLEINQSGQFLFLEPDLPQLPLLRAFSAMLLQARSDYDLDAMPEQVSMAAYLASPEHAQWWDAVSPNIRKDGEIPGVSRETAHT